ncbi:outer membrane lipoprotein-sorting protein [Chitinophaga agrisoli]|uniref:Outer membrane lipoprotein-sorting protein n=1 Tax=Chitinophaga agrisoli TaxID=2607653 RepID=A0A5B2W5U1_9BACT|nr:outer membrane lipoprotein-sorting protein [Chitinophaga agrisoli]KAA2245589.1 outer membrane lipoprotein-sorting protein [Chitinophaga agrisoli]
MKMSKMLTLLFIAVTTVCGVHAQTVDDIVNKHIAAMGGADKLKDLQSMYTEGVMEVRGMEIPIKLWVVNDKAIRMEFEVMGSNNIQVVTRDKGWMQMAMQGNEPKEMDSAMVRTMQPRLDLAGELYNYKARGRKITLEGKETTDGAEAYKLKVLNPNGAELTIFVDAATYYIDKIKTRMNVQGQDMELTTVLSDYKKTPNGFVYPSSTTQDPIGTKISVSKVDINQPVDDSLFQMPKK